MARWTLSVPSVAAWTLALQALRPLLVVRGLLLARSRHLLARSVPMLARSWVLPATVPSVRRLALLAVWALQPVLQVPPLPALLLHVLQPLLLVAQLAPVLLIAGPPR